MQHVFSGNNRSNKAIWSISQRGFQNNIWLQNLYNFSILNPFDILVFEDRRNRRTNSHTPWQQPGYIRYYHKQATNCWSKGEEKSHKQFFCRKQNSDSYVHGTWHCGSCKPMNKRPESNNGIFLTNLTQRERAGKLKADERWERWYLLNEFCLLFPTYVSKDYKKNFKKIYVCNFHFSSYWTWI